MCFFLDLLVLTCNISIETCAYVLLSWYALRGEGAAPPHPLLYLNRLPLLPTIPLFFHKHHPLFGLISSLLISIKTCAYVLLSWYALRGEALRPPPCTPPTRFYFFNWFPLLPTLFPFFHKHHRLFCFILSLLLSI